MRIDRASDPTRSALLSIVGSSRDRESESWIAETELPIDEAVELIVPASYSTVTVLARFRG